MRKLVRILAGLVVAGLVALFIVRTAFPTWWPGMAATEKNSTQPLFAASFPDAGNHVQMLSQWRGQVIVLNFWATWCPPCKEEMPELSAFQKQYRGSGLTVLGVSTDDVAKIAEFVQNAPVSYPVLSGDFAAMGLAEGLGNDKGVLPYTVLIARDGHVAATYFGRLDMQALEHDVRLLLKK